MTQAYEDPYVLEFNFFVREQVEVPYANITKLFKSERPDCPLHYSLEFPNELENHKWEDIMVLNETNDLVFDQFRKTDIPSRGMVIVIKAITVSGAETKKMVQLYMKNWAPYFDGEIEKTIFVVVSEVGLELGTEKTFTYTSPDILDRESNSILIQPYYDAEPHCDCMTVLISKDKFQITFDKSKLTEEDRGEYNFKFTVRDQYYRATRNQTVAEFTVSINYIKAPPKPPTQSEPTLESEEEVSEEEPAEDEEEPVEEESLREEDEPDPEEEPSESEQDAEEEEKAQVKKEEKAKSLRIELSNKKADEDS